MSMATFDHACTLYTMLEQSSEPEEIDEVPMLVWRGILGEAYKTLGVSQSYYSPIMDTLKNLGCITILSQGRRGRPTVVALHHAPDETEFIFYNESALTGAPESAKLRQRLETLEKRIGGVNIGEMLIDIDRRVKQLETLARKQHTKEIS